MSIEFDFVVVGAGSAGCVVTDILSRDGRYSVAVIEAGGSDRRLSIKVPIGYGRTFYDETVNWKYRTEPVPALNNRRDYWPRGKVVGGSSSINAMVYCRGMPSDFDDWRGSGADGWGWTDVRPYFEKLERHVAGDGRVSGNGPVVVADVSRHAHPCGTHFFAAAREVGLPMTDDFNGAEPEGVGHYRTTIRNGRRWSAADAFLTPALKRPTVRLFRHALAKRLHFEGRRAVGVEVRSGARTLRIDARCEVILCAGAVASPQLLQVSGVGPGEVLRRHGIDIVHESCRVGQGLQDHLANSYLYRATRPTLNNQLAPWWGKVRAGVTYALTRGGPLSLSVNQCGGFVRSRPGADRADTQLYFAPTSYTTAREGTRPTIQPDPFPGFLVCFQPSRPTSRGSIEIAAPDIAVPPSIRPNSLATDKDLDDVVAGGRLLQSMVRTPSLRELIAEALPPDIDGLDDEGLIEDFRRRGSTVFHPVSTCAMGTDPARSVVDTDLRVHELSGLRVIDASVFPNITSGNTNAPTLMVAYKGAEAILRDA